jgi:AmmeMemoRadiSam system protein A
MLSEQDKRILHDIAYQSIEQGLSSGHALRIDLSQYESALCEKRATFVTLNSNDHLRGCVGILEPLRPLIEDVAYNAFAAAFNDSRFEPLRRDELDSIDIHISILSTPEEMQFDSEQDLIEQLRPGKDGIILLEHGRKATFLPSVWQSLKNKVEFLEHLKQKAGLDRHYWSGTIRILRYSVDDV